ncbi:MAG: Chromosome partition protein Smc [Methanoregula sp. SKADARSKE-2]|nr:MAG: Chromosome partition protein Smc [Methanoregula sp. SKADARSKE-2]
MRILGLRFRNLNSLAGEWQIDFTHPEYESGGIFAIVGPTGSGKTTILDALCLALYGQTPRLGKITKTTNDLMTRHTGECFAEVTFESSEGKFRCHWSQRRAKKRADGELQQSEHEIADARTGRVLENKIKEVLGKVERCTGMNFEQFTRSMLLAQGEFATFLSAKPDERAPILEQITGTGIYTAISERVHDRTAREKMQLDTLQREGGTVQLLSDEEQKELDRVREERVQGATFIAGRKTKLERAISWLKQRGQLEEELAGLERTRRDIDRRREENRPELALLKKARVAREFEPDYALLQAKILAQEDLAGKTGRDRIAYGECDQAFRRLRDQIGERERRIQEHPADATLRENFGAIEQLVSAYQKTGQRLSSCEAGHRNASDHVAAARKACAGREEQREDLARDQAETKTVAQKLQQELAGILGDTEPSALYERKIDLTAEIERLTALTATILRSESLHQEQEDRKRSYQELSAEKTERQRALDQRLREIALNERVIRELDERRKNLLTIRDLAQERERLAAGEPCPLCGSRDHPYVDAHLPRIEETDEEREAYLRRLKTLRNEEAGIVRRITQIDGETAQNLLEEEKNRRESAANELLIATGTANLWIATDSEDRKRRIELSVTELTEELKGCDDVLAKVAELRKILANNAERARQLRSGLDIVQEEIHRAKLAIAGGEAEVNNLAAEIENLGRDLGEYLTTIWERLEPYGYRKPEPGTIEAILKDLEERRETYLRNEREREDLAATGQEYSAKLKSLADQIAGQKEALTRTNEEIIRAKNALRERILLAGFSGCAEFFASRIGRERFAALEALEEDLRTEEIRLASLISGREDALGRLRAEQLTDRSLTTLEEELAVCLQDHEAAQKEILEIRLKIDRHGAQMQAQKDLLERIRKQQAEYERWARLNALIGSHDGKKFRLFAQGITFDILLSHANQHLRRLNDRYLLLRTENNQLEMSVVDLHQAGEIRSTKNLSGGESFIVSLALALGLSDMASSNVRVDSLFLDEGFGTLDNESLEVALDALISLQRDGKLIGIISHVPALKERIATQLVVEKRHGGLSTLAGPGCTTKS